MQIGERIKKYELSSKYTLLPRGFIVIRVDGKAFHTFTKYCKKPFDNELIEAMVTTGELCAKEMQGFILGYHQSDEFTFLLSDLTSHESEMWFGRNVQKLASISASMFTAIFNKVYDSNDAMFDSRTFNVPAEEVPNVFIWRQRDWERNSLQMFIRSFFTQSEVNNKKKDEMHEMLHQKGKNWAHLPQVLKNGTFITKDGKRITEKLDYNKIKDLIDNLIKE